MSPVISIVIPAFNAEHTIIETIESLSSHVNVNQEIIVVDDGSQDSTLEVIKRYVREKSITSVPSIRIIQIDENRGVHEARVEGVKASKGDYVGFIDADDVALPGMYETLFQAMLEDQADIVVCGYYLQGDDGIKEGFAFDERECVASEVFARFTSLEFGFGSLCNKLYKKSVLLGLEDFQWRQDSHEDMLWNLSAFHKAEKVSLIKDVLYIYNKGRKDSATNSVETGKALARHFSAYALAVCNPDYSRYKDVDLINGLFRKTFSVSAYAVASSYELVPYRSEISKAIKLISEMRPEAIAHFSILPPPEETSVQSQIKKVITELKHLIVLTRLALLRRLSKWRR